MKDIFMIIDCISDLHGEFPKLDGGDLLLIAGDLTSNDSLSAWKNFFEWLKAQNYRKKIFIAGNHDNLLQFCISTQEAKHLDIFEDDGFEFLCDSGTEFEGLKIWGSPWIKWFKGIGKHCSAFTCKTEDELQEKFNQIHSETDILITHTPAFSVLDAIELEDGSEYYVGSTALRETIYHEEKIPYLKLHVFGHIHEQGGMSQKISGFTAVNASIMDEDYEPIHKPTRVIL